MNHKWLLLGLIGCAHAPPPHTVSLTHLSPPSLTIGHVPTASAQVDNPYVGLEEAEKNPYDIDDGVLDNPYDTVQPHKTTPENRARGDNQAIDNPYDIQVCQCLWSDPLCTCLKE